MTDEMLLYISDPTVIRSMEKYRGLRSPNAFADFLHKERSKNKNIKDFIKYQHKIVMHNVKMIKPDMVTQGQDRRTDIVMTRDELFSFINSDTPLKLIDPRMVTPSIYTKLVFIHLINGHHQLPLPLAGSIYAISKGKYCVENDVKTFYSQHSAILDQSFETKSSDYVFVDALELEKIGTIAKALDLFPEKRRILYSMNEPCKDNIFEWIPPERG